MRGYTISLFYVDNVDIELNSLEAGVNNKCEIFLRVSDALLSVVLGGLIFLFDENAPRILY